MLNAPPLSSCFPMFLVKGYKPSQIDRKKSICRFEVIYGDTRGNNMSGITYKWQNTTLVGVLIRIKPSWNSYKTSQMTKWCPAAPYQGFIPWNEHNLNHTLRNISTGKLLCDTRRIMSSFHQGGSIQDKEQTQVLWKHRIMFTALICLFSSLLFLHCLNYLKMDNAEQLEDRRKRAPTAVATVCLSPRD